MNYVRRISGKWSAKDVEFLKNYGIVIRKGLDTFGIKEDDKYYDVVKYLSDVEKFKDRRTFIEFDQEEYLPFNKFMLFRGYGLAGRLIGYGNMEWKRDAFGDFCPICYVPFNEQKAPFTFEREVTFSKKHLFFTMDGPHNYLFTDKERYDGILKDWGFGWREVLIGKSRKVSNHLVQLDIPVSPYKLAFGNSEFGKTFVFDGSGRIVDEFVVCPECGRPVYSNQILDYFPDFEQDFEFDMVHTQEWFSNFHQLIISRKFAEFLVNKKIVKWDSSYLIPVKKFKIL